MKMEQEINELVAKLAPAKDIAGGFMTRDQIIQLIHKVATQGALIGYTHAEVATRTRFEKKIKVVEQELTILRESLKDAELELIAASK